MTTCTPQKSEWNNLEFIIPLVSTMKTLSTGKKVLFIRPKKNYYEAKRICESICGKIFLPKSSQENHEVVSLLNNEAFEGKYWMAWLRASDRILVDIFQINRLSTFLNCYFEF